MESLKKRKIEEKKEIVQPKIKYEEIQEPQELQRFKHYKTLGLSSLSVRHKLLNITAAQLQTRKTEHAEH